MLRFDKPKLEGPLAAIGGSLVGGLIGGGGTLAGMASVGGLIGSAVGSLVGGTLLGKQKTPSIPSSTLPGAPTPPGLPQASELPSAGQASPATTTDLTTGELSTMKRRGRISTILSRQASGGEDIEKLGG